MRHARLFRLAENEVKRTQTKLPPEVRAAAEECMVLFEEFDDQTEEDEPDDLLGLFEGSSRLEAPPSGPEDMPRIRLFLSTLWDTVGHEERSFRREVRITYLHELGHYLGWDEEQVEALGLG